uniref:uS3m n=1 Tax=Trypanosoma brucei TaxID=5691 RepID=A0AC62AEI8_9TRYP|nr:Chain CC, uS3m [Trypanosoma brucei brucei]6HIW_CC Chain CC, uS3m [Trypanosoma brucei brucei]6HIZ_CC Chain CC, uS3m [Trypanosoma brucei brucei]6SG9_CC Chain CC, uS3m [Trypanosoma brucei brucei]6SGB_CC Chain CC, mS3m [Trypanosoma brucei brucei]7PUA_CC Chain CC, uS3m [Trypanosoma brucei brucei]7PUB_CC Chain CC, uS3m [Trypanosoma brucei brucei]
MFLIHFVHYKTILQKYTFKFKHIFLSIDKYNSLFFNISGILIWLNIIHINIILIKYSFFILINNFEYLIILIST